MNWTLIAALLLLSHEVYGGGIYFTKDESCADLKALDPDKPAQDVSTSPYTIKPSTLRYVGGEGITVVISSLTNVKIADMMVMPYCTSCTNPRQDMGMFETVDTEKLKYLDCNGIENSAAVSKGWVPQETLTLSWVPKPALDEKFYFEATIAFNDSMWWPRVKSAELAKLPPASPREAVSSGWKSSGSTLLIAFISLLSLIQSKSL